jgi:phosphate transport system permease protein
MTTLMSEAPEIREQDLVPQRPWSKHPTSFWLAALLGTAVPLSFAGVLYFTTEIAAPLLLIVVYLPLQLVSAGVAGYVAKGKHGILDSGLIVFAIGSTILSAVILGSMLATIIARGFEALRPSFIFQNSVYISPSTPLDYGGIGHAIVGTFLIVGIATIISVPLGIATAVYVTEIRGRAVPYVRFFVQAMSGVPSVVAGLFVLTVFILTGVMRQSALAGAIAYAILMLPTVARTAEEVLRLVPEDLRTGALALGSTRSRVVFNVVLPAARTGVITAMLLGVARVVGETAPLLLTALKNDQTVVNPFSDPISALPTFIFDNVAQPYPDAVTRAWGAALVLMVIVAVLFTLTRLLSGRNSMNK